VGSTHIFRPILLGPPVAVDPLPVDPVPVHPVPDPVDPVGPVRVATGGRPGEPALIPTLPVRKPIPVLPSDPDPDAATGPVSPLPLIVRDVYVQDRGRCRGPVMSMRSMTSARTVRTHLSA
jgi:hypothetical protein